ncbi:PIN domain-containing protein [bacterium]|nr:PIN domain-containing protein [bacterium]MBU1615995.1 PIN domain-containing protein [bacterium]
MYVTDAHSLAWYFTKSNRLSPKALKVFRSSANGECTVVIPSIVLAEILYISEKKRIKIDFNETVEKIEKGSNFEIADLNLEILKKTRVVKDIPEMHDRIIVATALIYSASVLTKDEEIRKSGQVNTIW